jgi:hypothetical protein
VYAFGIVLSATAVAVAVLTLALLARDWFVRRAHGIDHPDFFRMGSGLVFGVLGALLLLGLSLTYIAA